MKVSFVNITADPEQTMAYIARVSNPSNQNNENYAGLLRYCITHQHPGGRSSARLRTFPQDPFSDDLLLQGMGEGGV